MSLRLKVVLSLVSLCTLATVLIGVFSYRTTATQSLRQVDASLATSAADLRGRSSVQADFDRGPTGPRFRAPGDVVVQVVTADGDTRTLRGLELPVSTLDEQIAWSGAPSQAYRTVDVDGEAFRVLTVPTAPRGAVQVARSLSGTEAVLVALRQRILVAALVIATVGAAVGWFIARQITRRLERVTRAAELVTETGDLGVEVPVDGSDEAGRLGAAVNEMLAALSRSRSEQRRLVQDAGHELRTPLTSLRTNVFTLRRAGALSPDQLDQVLDDLESEAEELTRLVNEVVGVATDQRASEQAVEVELGAIARDVAARTGQRTGRQVLVDADDAAVIARPMALDRAIGNLVENAVKFDISDTPVRITCRGGRVEVRDNGPGIDDVDQPFVFQRFYRADAARSRPGSGLGLAIVADVIESHDGSVFAYRAVDGEGTVVGFELPVTPLTGGRLSPDSHLG